MAESSTRAKPLWLFLSLFAVLLVSRLCHAGILWADEDYHIAAGVQALFGKMPYRDFWYDKPPLNIAASLLFGAMPGIPLRIASAVYATLFCAIAYVFAKRLWGPREANVAAILGAFSLIFYFPGSTLTLEPDTWMMLPHLAAVYLAWSRRPALAGAVAAICTWFNVKGLFVLLACAAFNIGGLPALVAGFVIPNLAGVTWLVWQDALAAYWQQVWEWGFRYARSPEPIGSGLVKASNWTGFHAAIVISSFACFLWGKVLFRKDLGREALWREGADLRPFAIWAAVSLAGVAVGLRFTPRYFDQLLPVLVIVGARGFVLMWGESKLLYRAVLIIALLIPAIRFGPRYIVLAEERIEGIPHRWTDVAMDQDSQAAAGLIAKNTGPGDSIFIWGYRPNLIAYTRLPVAGRFWDSQPLTGVPADRHLSSEVPVAADWAAQNRREVIQSRPTIIADGLSFFNPKLDPHRFPEVAAWLENYCVAGRTAMTIVYKRCR